MSTIIYKNSTNIKTWLTGLNDVQSAINKMSGLSNAMNGASLKFTDTALVQQYANTNRNY